MLLFYYILYNLKAAIFGILMLVAITLSAALWQENWVMFRYDALTLYAIALQIWMIASKRETLLDFYVILLFHFIGSSMEWYKVARGSWAYPEEAYFQLFNVPLFVGFMYGSVASYMVQMMRLSRKGALTLPHPVFLGVLALLICVNFVTNHYIIDFRAILFLLTLLLFYKTYIVITIPIPIIGVIFVASLALYMAENIGTVTATWAYKNQSQFEFVALSKIGSWYLLLFVSFITIILTHPQYKKR